MSKVGNITLATGAQLPAIGLGTYCVPGSNDQDKVYQAIKDAISAGFRHIDTASVYLVEKEVGRAIKEAIAAGVVTRAELFVTSKLWLRSMKKDDVAVALGETLRDLGLEYLDLYLVNWPTPLLPSINPPLNPIFDNETDVNTETWPAMEQLVKDGLVKNIGIANFNSKQIEALLAVATIKPAVLQIESHPFLSQRKLIDFAGAKGIQVVAFSPLGGSPVVKDMPYHSSAARDALEGSALIKNLAKAYNKSPAQILLKFNVQRGLGVIVKSVTKARFAENLDIFDFELKQSEIEQLEALNSGTRYCEPKYISAHKSYPFAAGVEF